jgi:hypothetical protein
MQYNRETGEVADDEFEPEDEYELIGRYFEAQFPGHCTIDYEHLIRRGDKVSRVQHSTNPMLPVAGVCCQACFKVLPKAKR